MTKSILTDIRDHSNLCQSYTKERRPNLNLSMIFPADYYLISRAGIFFLFLISSSFLLCILSV